METFLILKYIETVEVEGLAWLRVDDAWSLWRSIDKTSQVFPKRSPVWTSNKWHCKQKHK